MLRAHSANFRLLRAPMLTKYVQLDWPSETETLKINFPQDREGYIGFEYTDEKLSTRRIRWYGDPSCIFWGIFEQ